MRSPDAGANLPATPPHRKEIDRSKTNELIPAGFSIFVDAGSTCLEAIKILTHRADIRLITHSINLVAACSHAEASIICIGGEMRKVSGPLLAATCGLPADEDFDEDDLCSAMDSLIGHWCALEKKLATETFTPPSASPSMTSPASISKALDPRPSRVTGTAATTVPIAPKSSWPSPPTPTAPLSTSPSCGAIAPTPPRCQAR